LPVEPDFLEGGKNGFLEKFAIHGELTERAMGVLFGTDGIRGRANRHPMTAEVALKVGRAAALLLGRPECGGAVIIGQDPRVSGDMLAQAAAAGVLSAGLDACRVGVVPTPAVARLVVETAAPLGVMISASHNPFEDNGIKIFQAGGYKLDDGMERQIEALVLGGDSDCGQSAAPPGEMRIIEAPLARYRRFLAEAVPLGTLEGFGMVVDCANGATSAVAPRLFRDLGARVSVIADRPDGRNINRDCGSEHPGELCRSVVAAGARVGLAFDGDGDRIRAVDETGKVLTGDQLIAIFAESLLAHHRLNPKKVVTTVMSNLGLKTALRNLGIDHEASAVGDRRVMEKMVSTGAVLGGEDSGHIIFRDLHTTGDGVLSGLRLLALMMESGRPLSELARVITVFPQVMINVAVRAKPPISDLEPVRHEIQQVEAELDGKGRVLVRYSGTEPLCRVMVEGPTASLTESLGARIAAAVAKTIGV
jgi:phosphoglucosamine mutase